MNPTCDVCGEAGYWVAWLAWIDDADQHPRGTRRCANHLMPRDVTL